MIREVDVEEEEDEHSNKKFKERADLVDKDARVSMKRFKVTASTMKYYHRCNHCGERDMKVNNRASLHECPQCRDKEMWEHAV